MGVIMSNALYTPTADFKIERSPLTVLQTDMHYHHAYQLYYAIEGEHEYLIGDTFYKISKGDLVWIPVDTVHCTDRKSASRFLVYFKPSFVNKYVQPLMRDKLLGSAPFVFHGDASTDAQLFELFNKLHSEYARQQKQPQYADELLLVKYLLQIMFLLYTAENVYRPAIPEDNRMSNILKYVNENYPYISGMDEIAGKFYISKYYLCHLFKEHMEVSFISYLNTIKIRAACELLRTGNLPLSQIATSCGFNSTPYFCKVFKEEKGISPSQYRKQARLI